MTVMDAILVYAVWFAVACAGSGIAMLILGYRDEKRQRAFRAEQLRQRLTLKELDEQTWGERARWLGR